MNKKKLLKKILAGGKAHRFADVVSLAEAVGFTLNRVQGSHHIFIHRHVPEIINLQEVRGEAKPYQVRQLVKVIEKHNLKLGD